MWVLRSLASLSSLYLSKLCNIQILHDIDILYVCIYNNVQCSVYIIYIMFSVLAMFIGKNKENIYSIFSWNQKMYKGLLRENMNSVGYSLSPCKNLVKNG